MKKLLMSLMLVLLIVVPITNAIGVAPASKEVFMEDTTYNIKIINEHKEEGEFQIKIVGDLEEYIELSENSILFNKESTSKTITVRLIKPMKQLEEGEYLSRIIIEKVGKNSEQINAQVGVVSKLLVVEPYTKAAIETEIFAPNFEQDKENAFTLKTFNKGIKDAENCFATINIFNMKKELIDSLNITLERIPKEKIIRTPIQWKPAVAKGNYNAKSHLVCNGISDFSEVIFSVGQPEISIDSLIKSIYDLGGISKFDLILSNMWAQPIKGVFAEIELTKDSEHITGTKTESIEIDGNSKAVIPVYLDFTNVNEGKYVIETTVKFLNKEVNELFEADFSKDKVVINSLAGKITSDLGENSVDSDYTYSLLLIVIGILVLLVINFSLIILKKRK